MAKKKQFCMVIMDISKEQANVEFATDEDLNLKLVETEEEAEVFIKYEYSKHYILFGMLPSPVDIHAKIRKKMKCKQK